MNETLTYLSFGAGVQSSALLVMSALGLRNVPRADLAIFADTQNEPTWVYEHLERMREFATAHSIPLKVVTAGNLGEHALVGDFCSVPLWVRGEGGRASLGRRQCTADHKISVLESAVREHLGYLPRQHVRHSVRALIGISWDERQRVKLSRTKWITNCYPLVELRVTVAGCLDLLDRVGIPSPKKSACVFCPYHSDAYWLDLRANHPDEFAKACEWDERFRAKKPQYVHRSLSPLRMAEFDASKDQTPSPAGLFDDFANECDGMCGV